MKVSFISFFLLIAMSQYSFASRFYLETKGSSQESKTLKMLVQSQIENLGHQVSSSRKNSDYKMKAQVVPLGGSRLITVQKFKNGKVVSSQKAKAHNVEDMDTVVDRLVSAVVNNTQYSQTERVDNISKGEAQNQNIKKEVTRQFIFGFGPGATSRLETTYGGFNFLIGMLWGIEPNFALRLNLEHLNINESEASFTDLTIGGNYYLNLKKHAPYATAGVGYSWAESDEVIDNCSFLCRGKRNSGWGARIGLGYHFYRSSKVNFAVEAKYNQAFYNVVSKAPSSYSLNLLILW